MQELAREFWNLGLVCVRDSKVASISVIADLALFSFKDSFLNPDTTKIFNFQRIKYRVKSVLPSTYYLLEPQS